MGNTPVIITLPQLLMLAYVDNLAMCGYTHVCGFEVSIVFLTVTFIAFKALPYKATYI